MSVSYDGDYEYAHAKLSESVVLYENKPYWVMSVHSNGMTELSSLFFREYKEVPLEDIDLTPVQLGYVNYSNTHCAYLYRIPVRGWKQGLRPHTIGGVSGVGNYRLDSLAMCNCIENIYPSFEEIQESLVNEEITKGAFHKNFALGYDFVKKNFPIYFKDSEIGITQLNNKRDVILNPKFSYLKEFYEEAITNVKG